jgi:hypothetical protein
MNSTTAAQTAKVTVATIRTWCRRGVIAAVKTSGRWIIEAASLAHRIALGAKHTTEDHTGEFLDELDSLLYDAADRRAAKALRRILDLVKARDTKPLTFIDPLHVHLTGAQWSKVEQSVSFQIACLSAEH